MGEINKCRLPDDLHYHVEFNVWLRDNSDGTWDLGMTDIAQSLAGAIIHCRPKKVGKTVKAGRSVATVESGKWVGPVKSPFTAEVVARNDDAEADAAILNRSPYKAGWIVRIRPLEVEDPAASLVQGEAALEGFKGYMAEKGLEECVHCDGFECD